MKFGEAVEAANAVGTWTPFLVMKTVDNTLVPWLASQTDVLAEDWSVVEASEGPQPAQRADLECG